MKYHIDTRESNEYRRIASFDCAQDRDDVLDFLEEKYLDCLFFSLDT